MKNRNLKEITQTDSHALTVIIGSWNVYDATTVLLAYAELKKRNYSLNTTLIKWLNEFCAKQNGADIDTLLASALKDIGYNSYDECYEKEIDAMQKAETEKGEPEKAIKIGSSINDSSEKKYPALRTIDDRIKKKYHALRTISGIYKIFGFLMIVATLIAAFMAAFIVRNNESGIFALIALGGALIALGVFAFAESIMVFIDIEENTRTNNKQRNDTTTNL